MPRTPDKVQQIIKIIRLGIAPRIYRVGKLEVDANVKPKPGDKPSMFIVCNVCNVIIQIHKLRYNCPKANLSL